MILFFFSFLSIYGAMHCYAFYHLRRLYLPPLIVLLPITLFLILSPLLVRLVENAGLETIAWGIALPGYTWMGFIFLFCISLFTSDLIAAAIYLFRRSRMQPDTAKLFTAVPMVIALVASSYSLFEAQNITVESVTITAKKSSGLTRPVRIVQISDVHLGLMMSEKRLSKIISRVTLAKPDLLVSTGDLVDGRLSKEHGGAHLERLVTLLKSVQTPLGNYAIVGNHEYYAGFDDAVSLTRRAGFTMLLQQSVTLPVGITISGVTDPAEFRKNTSTPGGETSLISSNKGNKFNLLLKHRPVLDSDSDGVIDVQLSGHTHKGQLLPFYPLTWLKFPIHSGTTATQKGTIIHVSRGSGTWGPPMRLLAPPEVTVMDIVP